MPAKTQIVKEKSTFDEAVRSQLHKIISSKSFRQGDRLQRFLGFIVDESLAGRGDQLKEYPIGVDVFGKSDSFDPRMDPIVRVQARRLRIRLQTYYREEGQADDLVIEMPKGGYAPTFRQVDPSPVKRPHVPALVSRNTVAVRAFEDCSPNGAESSFCRGLASEIVHALSKVDSIVVMDESSTRQESLEEAAVFIGGTVRTAQGTMRITMQMTDTMRGSILWSESIDRRYDDVFALQEEIAATVIGAVMPQLVGDSGGPRTKVGNLAANNMYLQGVYQFNQRTESGLRKAMEYFGKAAEEDPGFAKAYAGMSDAQLLMANYGVAAPTEVWTKTAANASHAVLLDDESSEAHTSLAHVKAIQDWDWSGSEKEFRKAIRLDPRNSVAHHWFAMSCLVTLGRLDEALQEIMIAQSLDPVSSIIARDMAQIYHFRREYDRALEQCDHTIEQNPHFSAAYWTLGLVQEQRGELEEAIAAFQRAIELSPPSPRIVGALARTYAIVGRKQDASRLLKDLNELSKKRYISPFELALIYFSLGRMDEGFERLELAFQHRCFELITLRIDPRFDNVRDDPRFQSLFSQLGLS
ncbi:putative integral membrane protein [Terriglobus roseus DSM 18391]|uniref:Putative integral membrane protein n=1 Tax=Terriglobus roseus (strain DSM 18391 / NRRL B-41598 / KBS 63) TaxID=926566 RepID=I3ZDI1_TERRK|nr:putative integral membrane protein [Terriglobus roseus DSM 18391]